MKPSTKEMGWMNMWLHHTPSILKQGRLTHVDGQAIEGEEDVEPEELLRREVAKDPWEPRLKPITNDNKTRGGAPAWIVRSYGVKDSFVNPKTGQSSDNYGVVVVKSLWWPGSFTFYNNQRT